jgi:hypothetical protein
LGRRPVLLAMADMLRHPVGQLGIVVETVEPNEAVKCSTVFDVVLEGVGRRVVVRLV